MSVLNVLAVDKAALHHEAAEGMCNEYDWALCRLLEGPVGRQPRGKVLSVVVNLVFRGAVREGSDIGIVPIGEDSYALLFKGRGKEI